MAALKIHIVNCFFNVFKALNNTYLILAEQSQIVKLLGHIGMFATQHFLPDLQGPLAQRLGVFVLPALAVQYRQIVQGGRNSRMVLAQRLLPDGQRVVQQIGRFLVFVLISENQHKNTIQSTSFFFKTSGDHFCICALFYNTILPQTENFVFKTAFV